MPLQRTVLFDGRAVPRCAWTVGLRGAEWLETIPYTTCAADEERGTRERDAVGSVPYTPYAAGAEQQSKTTAPAQMSKHST